MKLVTRKLYNELPEEGILIHTSVKLVTSCLLSTAINLSLF